MRKTRTTRHGTYRSPLLASVHETAKGLHDAGAAADRETDPHPPSAREGQPGGLRSLSKRYNRLGQSVGTRQKASEGSFPKAPYASRQERSQGCCLTSIGNAVLIPWDFAFPHRLICRKNALPRIVRPHVHRLTTRACLRREVRRRAADSPAFRTKSIEL